MGTALCRFLRVLREVEGAVQEVIWALVLTDLVTDLQPVAPHIETPSFSYKLRLDESCAILSLAACLGCTSSRICWSMSGSRNAYPSQDTMPLASGHGGLHMGTALSVSYWTSL